MHILFVLCFYCVHVSGSHVPIIRRINSNRCDIWYMSLCATCIQDGHLHRGTYTGCRIDTVLLMMGTWLPETCREQKLIYKKKKCTSSSFIYKDYTKMQQHVKRTHRSVIWCLSGSTTLVHIVSNGTIFLGGRSGFGGLEVACWPLVPKFAGSNPAEAVRFLRGK